MPAKPAPFAACRGHMAGHCPRSPRQKRCNLLACPAQHRLCTPLSPEKAAEAGKGSQELHSFIGVWGGSRCPGNGGQGRRNRLLPISPSYCPPLTPLQPWTPAGPALHSGILGFSYPPIAHGELEPMSGIHDSRVLLPAGLCEILLGSSCGVQTHRAKAGTHFGPETPHWAWGPEKSIV